MSRSPHSSPPAASRNSTNPKKPVVLADQQMHPLSYSNTNDLSKRVVNKNGRKGFLESFDNVFYEVIKEKNDAKKMKRQMIEQERSRQSTQRQPSLRSFTQHSPLKSSKLVFDKSVMTCGSPHETTREDLLANFSLHSPNQSQNPSLLSNAKLNQNGSLVRFESARKMMSPPFIPSPGTLHATQGIDQGTIVTAAFMGTLVPTTLINTESNSVKQLLDQSVPSIQTGKQSTNAGSKSALKYDQSDYRENCGVH